MVLADDHHVVRDGLRRLLEDAEMRVVAGVADGLTAVEMTLRHRPDLVLMDVAMPVMGGIDATRRIVRSWPEARVLLLSMYGEDGVMREAVRAGAAGYLVKDCSRAELLAATQSVLAGAQVFSVDDDDPVDASPALTERQIEILQLLADGYRPKQVARALKISERTVNNHLAAAYRNLGASTRLEAVLEANRLGLVDLHGGSA